MSKHNFTHDHVPALMAYLGGAGLKLVDVGGRGSALGQLVPLAPVAHYYTCEPDAQEADRLRETLPAANGWRGVTVIAEAIASQQGEATLYLTHQLGMSSLLEPDPAVGGHFYLHGKFEVVRTVTVPAVPLDVAAEHYGFSDACFLKIDTQGTELDILRSGERLVQSLMGVHVECSFRPFYKHQPLFSDVDSYLRSRGFSLYTMSRTNLRRNGYRADLYSRRITTWAHCLYLREADTLARDAAFARRLPQLLALALAFQQFDLALELVTTAGREGLLSGADLAAIGRDIETVAAYATTVITRKAARYQPDETALTRPDYRDRKQLE